MEKNLFNVFEFLEIFFKKKLKKLKIFFLKYKYNTYKVLEKKEKEYRIPKTDLDSYLRFKLIVDVSESINSLIYLPFIMIFVVTIGRSTYFDALGLPLSLIVVFVLLDEQYNLNRHEIAPHWLPTW